MYTINHFLPLDFILGSPINILCNPTLLEKGEATLHAFYTHPCHRLFPVFVFLFVILSLETNMSLTVGSDVSHTILI